MESVKKNPKKTMVHKDLLWPLKIKQPCTAMLLERSLMRKKFPYQSCYEMSTGGWGLLGQMHSTHISTHDCCCCCLQEKISRFTSEWVWPCWWDRGGISQRINASWEPPCPCKRIGVSCFTAISAFGKVPSNSSSQTHCPESVLLSVYKN